MNSICLVLPFFGTLPPYFPFFLESCKLNRTIDWLLITDQPLNSVPSNIHLVSCSFDAFRNIVQGHFDFPICLDHPYKLCDFKPAYGEILSDFLSAYDFWGHCDCDMIFGDLRSFLDDSILIRFNKFFSRGHLTIYRNKSEVNSYYRIAKELDYRKVFSSPASYAFDEWNGISHAWETAGLPFYDPLIMDDIQVGYDGFHLTKEIHGVGSPYHSQNKDESFFYRNMKCIHYQFENGALFRKWIQKGEICSSPVLYAHFQKRNLECPSESNSSFLIIPDQIIESQDLSIKSIKKMIKSNTIHNQIMNLKKVYYQLHRM